MKNDRPGPHPLAHVVAVLRCDNSYLRSASHPLTGMAHFLFFEGSLSWQWVEINKFAGNLVKLLCAEAPSNDVRPEQ